MTAQPDEGRGRLAALEDENRLLRATLAECHAELSSLRDENEALLRRAKAADTRAQEAFGQLEIARTSLAWKLMTPMRLLRETLRF